MKHLQKVTAIALLLALLAGCTAAFAEVNEPVKVEQYLYTNIDEAGAALGLTKIQEQDDEAFMTLYDNEGITIGGRDGVVVDINIFSGDYSLYGVTVGMTKEEAEAKLAEQNINYHEDSVVEINQDTIVFEVPGHEDSNGCLDLDEGLVNQMHIDTTIQEETEEPVEEAKPASKATEPKAESGYLKLTGSAHLRKNADKESSSLKVLEKGTKLKYSATAKDGRGVTWYKVKSGKQTGWVSSKYAKKISKKEYEKQDKPKEKKEQGLIVLTGKAHVRKAPDKDSKKLDTFAKGSELKYTATCKDSRGVVWYKVSADGVTGWISSKNAKKMKLYK